MAAAGTGVLRPDGWRLLEALLRPELRALSCVTTSEAALRRLVNTRPCSRSPRAGAGVAAGDAARPAAAGWELGGSRSHCGANWSSRNGFMASVSSIDDGDRRCEGSLSGGIPPSGSGGTELLVACW